MAFAADNDIVEIVCSVRDTGSNLDCVWVGHEKKMMTSDDVQAFIDQANVYAYITVKSQKGFERTFVADPKSAPFKKLSEVKKNGSISEISRAKLELFAEIEKKVIKLSQDLDTQASSADFVKYDAAITTERYRREVTAKNKELDSFRSGKNKLCVATPEYENSMKLNKSLQTTVSKMLTAFQTSGTCLDAIKIAKDKEGYVDLKQFDTLDRDYVELCKKK